MSTATTTTGSISDQPVQLDHIIILVSPADFTTPPTWLTSNFTIIEGGTHSKGTSRNKLIIFRDGTYLELFSWTDPQPTDVPAYADFPSWANKPEGCIIDWALTGEDAQAKYTQLTRSLGDLRKEHGDASMGVQYDEPREGGRKRKDGKELAWVTTRPSPRRDANEEEISTPFFCHDVTDRQLRVPSQQNDITNHPCGATGVAGIVIEVAQENLEKATKLYEAILGGHHAPAVRRDGASIFNVDVPDPGAVSTTESTSDGGKQVQRCSIHLQTPDEENSFSRAKTGTSIRRLVLFTESDERKGDQIDRDGFGTPINLC